MKCFAEFKIDGKALPYKEGWDQVCKLESGLKGANGLIEDADIDLVVPGGPLPEDADERKRKNIRIWANRVRYKG
jgi:hypothetical protein